LRIALISCTKLKQNYPCASSEMYQKSTLFKKASGYINELNYDKWFILSAKYGLVSPNEIIEPYDETLNNMKSTQIKVWSDSVLNELMKNTIEEVDFYAGEKYRKYIIPQLEGKGIKCNVPLKGLGIGQQLGFYTRELSK
jgi:cytoplasmic iron level regulating protein YaaA (DUF328/UPF0246 family)